MAWVFAADGVAENGLRAFRIERRQFAVPLPAGAVVGFLDRNLWRVQVWDARTGKLVDSQEAGSVEQCAEILDVHGVGWKPPEELSRTRLLPGF